METSESRDFYEEGKKYLKTAVNGHAKRPEIFNSEILYNLLAMSIEKNFMAVLLYHNDLADNHTFTDLIDSVSRHLKLDEKLIDDLKKLELQQDLCPIHDSFKCEVLPADMLETMIAAAETVEELAAQYYPKAC